MASGGAVQSLALAFGVGAAITLLGDRLKQPPILFLLVAGFAFGASGLGLINGDAMGTSGLLAVVSVSVGLLVFEGGLGLDRRTLARAPGAVRGLLTVGIIVSWALTAVLGRYVIGLPWDLSILLGSMLVVTGPTVIQPILRRTPLRPGLHSALTAEGILIDPIGVVAAVSTLEIVRLSISRPGATGPLMLLEQYGVPAIAGLGFGALAGAAAAWWLRRARRTQQLKDQTLVLMGLAACMISFGAAEVVAKEAGLVAATVCGMLLANAASASAEEMRRFKETTSVILVGALFILLASRVELERVRSLQWSDGLFVLLLIVVVRPIAVFAATVRTMLGFREKLFASVIAPRGIVAASLGSIVAIELTALAAEVQGRPDLAENAQRIESLVLLVIVATVALAGAVAGPLASILGVRAGEPNGVLVVGGHRLGRELARELIAQRVPVKLVDTNAANIARATSWGVPTALGNATDARWMEEEVATPEFGRLIALTDNDDVDGVVTRWAAARFGAGRVLVWRRDDPSKLGDGDRPGTALQWGRPLRHLLFQMDSDLARCTTWSAEDPPSTGAVAAAALLPGGDIRLIDGGDAASAFDGDPPEGTRFVGVVIGPPPKPAKRNADSDEGS
ncbi:MAG: cation:proton antiporter [Planctomycetota bacterium]